MKHHLFIFFQTADRVAASNAYFLEEGGRTWEIDKLWSVRMDPPHQPGMSQHVHVMLRGNDVCIVNRDGTPSHGTNPAAAPNWVLDKIRQKGLLEQSHLIEGGSPVILPKELIARTEFRAQLFDYFDSLRLKRLREIIPFRTRF